MNVIVKICGITRIADAEAAIDAGADVIGLNFYAPSPRHVEVDQAAKIRDAIGSRARVAGVFVNSSREFIQSRLRELRLDLIQLHGDEDDSFLVGWPVPVIRALRIRDGADLRASIVSSRADLVLLDTFHERLYGGTGAARPLSGLTGVDLSRAFVSGGLSCDNVAEAAALRPYGVDVASGVESAPGIKDHRKLRSFLRNAKSAR